MGRIPPDSLAGACGSGGFARVVRGCQVEYQEAAPVCREPADQGGGAAARQVQFPFGAYHEQSGGRFGGVLYCAAVRLGDAPAAAYVGPAARVLRRTLVDGCPVRIFPGHPELCHRAFDMDARVLGRRRDGLCNCERFFQVAGE